MFEQVPTGFAFRLWDGTLVRLGGGAPVCTAVVIRPATFVRLMRDPSPLNFAEAYVDGALDIEGDLFAAMKVADALEEIRLSRDRLRLFVPCGGTDVALTTSSSSAGDRAGAPPRGGWPAPASGRCSSTPRCSRASRSAPAG